MGEPVVLRIVRPYDNADDYITAEGWTLNRRGAVLLDQGPLEAETPVRFDISLRSGERLVLAEGVVMGVLSANERRPGGLKVRFTRCGTSTKNFIERALEAIERPRSAAAPAAATASRPNGSRYPRHSTAPGAGAASLKPGRSVAAPPNRNELLEQLRQRYASRQSSATLEASSAKLEV